MKSVLNQRLAVYLAAAAAAFAGLCGVAFADTSAENVASAASKPAKVLVIGDSLGKDLYFGLHHLYKSDGGAVVRHLAKPATGIVRDDVFDWNARAATIARKAPADVVIMMIGGNDMQPIAVPGERYRAKVGTDKWAAAYGDRAEKLMREFTDRGVAFIWIGMPPQRRPNMDANGKRINAILRERTEAANAVFLDIYADFADPNGGYTATLVDASGKKRLMRKKDGVHFTTRGVGRLADIVKQALDRRFRAGDDPVAEAAEAAAKPTGSEASFDAAAAE